MFSLFFAGYAFCRAINAFCEKARGRAAIYAAAMAILLIVGVGAIANTERVKIEAALALQGRA
jgi:hypothetical protein